MYKGVVSLSCLPAWATMAFSRHNRVNWQVKLKLLGLACNYHGCSSAWCGYAIACGYDVGLYTKIYNLATSIIIISIVDLSTV